MNLHFVSKRDVEDPGIKNVCVIYNTSRDSSNAQENRLFNFLKSLSVTILTIQDRPTFGQTFELANKLYPDSVVIVANADIFFNTTLKKLKHIKWDNTFLALTRWDVDHNWSFVRVTNEFSQDVWIFKTPLKPFIKSHFQLGKLFCDNAIAYWAVKSGLRVLNPSLTVQACHLHWSGIRHYTCQTDYPLQEMLGIKPTTAKENTTEYLPYIETQMKRFPAFIREMLEQQSNKLN